MKIFFGLLLFAFLVGTSNAQQAVPGLVEVAGFVCHERSAAESIGEAWAKGGPEAAQQQAQAQMQAQKCGVLKETMWAIAKDLKIYSYQGRVAHLMEFDIEGNKFYGLLDKGEVLA